MAEPTKPTLPPAPPPAPKQTVAEKARAETAKGKAGFDPMRPFRYGKAFIGGTILDGLNGMANWGRRGLKWGLGGGVLAAIGLPALNLSLGLSGTAAAIGSELFGIAAVTAPALLPVVMCVAVGFLACAALGTAHGLLTGGMRALNREHRRDKYAEDLVQRRTIRDKAPSSRADYRAQLRAREARSDFMTAYSLEREAEARRDASTYWSDREQRSSGGMSRW